MRGFAILLAIVASVAAIVVAARHRSRNTSQPIVIQPIQTGPRLTYPPGRYPVLTLPDGEKQTVRSVLNIDRPMRFGDYVWNEAAIPAGPAWVRIDLSRQMISVFRGGHEIGSAVILYGTDGKPTPTGVFPVLEKAREHRSNLYDAEMPFMLRLTNDGVAIHASDVEQGSATHGCIGVPIGFAEHLFDAIERGDRVAILTSA